MELEESLALYARGVELVKDLRGRLDTAEQKVKILLMSLRQELQLLIQLQRLLLHI